jgi:DNA-binding response OmpR family regulator
LRVEEMISSLLEEGKRIMIVDDDNDCVFTIKIVLERYGFKVHSFNNAYSALESYRATYYDLVILDIILPGMNGFQLYREIKKMDKNVKVCFLSAGRIFYGTYQDIFSEIDASYLIRKPIENQKLVRRVEQIIQMDSTQLALSD